MAAGAAAVHEPGQELPSAAAWHPAALLPTSDIQPRVQTSTEATQTLTAGATLPTLFGAPLTVPGAASSGSVSTQSISGTVLNGQASSATVVGSSVLVDGMTFVFTVDTVLVPTLIEDTL